MVTATMEHRMEVTRVRGGGRDKLEIGIDIYTPLYIKAKTVLMNIVAGQE